MSTVPTIPNSVSQKSNAHRAVFTVFSILAIIFAFWGFKLFYLKLHAYVGPQPPEGIPLPPPIKTVMIVHGVMMTIWLVLLLVQTLLIFLRKPRLHMAIGRIGAIYAFLVILVGIKIAIDSTRYAPPNFQLWGLNAKQFMAIPFLSIILFTILIAIGVWKRKKPAIHRTAMIIATLGALSAAFDRITAFGHIHEPTFLGKLMGPYVWPIVLGILILAFRSILTKKFDTVFALGLAVLTIFGIAVMQIAQTDAWVRFTTMLVG